MSLTQLARGTASISSVTALRALTQLAILPWLSRLLVPYDFGVISIAMPFVFFGMLLADAGIGMSVMKSPLTERKEWSTCFWLSAALCALLALALIALSSSIAALYAEPQLKPVITVLALIVGAHALFYVPRAAQQQSQHFRIITRTEIAAITCSAATTIVVASHGGGVWSLVAQHMSYYAVRILLTFWLSPFRPQRTCHLRQAHSHIKFGSGYLGSNIVGFATQSFDMLLVGKILGSAAVGLYAMSVQFARLPMLLLCAPLQYVMFAPLVRLRHNIDAMAQAFTSLTRIVALIVFPAVGMLAAAHDPVFRLLLSDSWAPSGRVFMLMAVASALQALAALAGILRMALQRTDLQLRSSLEFSLLWGAILCVTVWQGIECVALAYSISVAAYLPRSLMLVLPLLNISWRGYMRLLVVPATVTAVCIFSYNALGHFMALTNAQNIASCASMALTGMLAIALLQRRTLHTELARLQHMLSQPETA